MSKNRWYAVMEDWFDDTRRGSKYFGEALEMLKEQKCGFIAVIENGYCVEEILYDVIQFEE